MSDGARWRRLVGAGLVALVSLTAPARDARAQAEAAPPRPRPEIWVHVAAEGPVVEALADRLGARLEALGATMSLDGVGTVDVEGVLNGGADPAGRAADASAPLAASPPLAEVWLDGRVAREATLLLVPRATDRILARRISLPAGFDEVALAEIVYIVDRAIQTLLASELVGVPREEARAALEAPAPAPAPAPPVAVARRAPPRARPRARPLAFQIGVAAGAATWSSDDPLLPAGGLFAAFEHVEDWGRIGFTLGAGLRGVVRTTTPEARIAAGEGEAHVWLTVGRAFGRAGLWRLSFGPGVVVDRVQVTPDLIAAAQGTVKAESRTDVDPSVGASLRWDVAAIGRSVIFAAAGVDVVTRAGRYTKVVDGTTSTLFAPWPVRPSLMVGFALDLGSR